MTIGGRAQEVFSLDLRSLAAARIAVGLLLLADLFHRSMDFAAHYTDAGVLPVDLLVLSQPYTRFSPFAWSGSAEWQALLFAGFACVAAALALGWRTRLMTVLAWLLLISLHKRNSFLLYGGDQLLRMALFWAMFLPWGRRFSLDARRGEPGPERVFSAASFAFFVQTGLIYGFSVLHKLFGPEWRNGSAVRYALNIDMYATPAARELLAYPELMSALSYATLAAELAVPLLLFSPVRNAACRIGAVAVNYFLHLGFGLCMMLGMFPVIGTIFSLVFLPSAFWDREEKKHAYSGAPAAANAFVLALLFYVCLWNVANFHKFRGWMPAPLRTAGLHLKLVQHWGMFAPAPMKNDRWPVVEAVLESGKSIDLFRNGKPVSFAKPAKNVTLERSHRWQEYMLKGIEKKAPQRCRAFGDYLVREWRKKHGAEKIRSVKLWHVVEKTLPEGTAAPEKRLIYGYEPAA